MTRRTGAALLAALVLAGLCSGFAPAQTVSLENQIALRQGTHVFRRILHERGFHGFLANLDELPDSETDPGDHPG